MLIVLTYPWLHFQSGLFRSLRPNLLLSPTARQRVLHASCCWRSISRLMYVALFEENNKDSPHNVMPRLRFLWCSTYQSHLQVTSSTPSLRHAARKGYSQTFWGGKLVAADKHSGQCMYRLLYQYFAHAVYLCVSSRSHNKQRLFPPHWSAGRCHGNDSGNHM
jgi:hypothetical protein